MVWEDNNWAYDPGALAITLTSFERSSGQFVDADIIINGADYNWSTTGEERKTISATASLTKWSLYRPRTQ